MRHCGATSRKCPETPTGGAPVSIGSPVTAAGARQLLIVTDTGALSAQASKFYRMVALAQ